MVTNNVEMTGWLTRSSDMTEALYEAVALLQFTSETENIIPLHPIMVAHLSSRPCTE